LNRWFSTKFPVFFPVSRELEAETGSLVTASSATPSTTNNHDAQVRLTQAVHELRLALPELHRHRARETETRDDLKKHEGQLAVARIEAEEASARLQVLRETVGAKVEELQRKLADVRAAVEASESVLTGATTALRTAGEARAVAAEQARAFSRLVAIS